MVVLAGVVVGSWTGGRWQQERNPGSGIGNSCDGLAGHQQNQERTVAS